MENIFYKISSLSIWNSVIVDFYYLKKIDMFYTV